MKKTPHLLSIGTIFALLLTGCTIVTLPQEQGLKSPHISAVKTLKENGEQVIRQYALLGAPPKHLEFLSPEVITRQGLMQWMDYQVKSFDYMSSYAVTTKKGTDSREQITEGKIIWVVTTEDAYIFDDHGNRRVHCYKVYAYWLVDNYRNTGMEALSPSGYSRPGICGPTFG